MKKSFRPDLRPSREKSLEELEGFVARAPRDASDLVQTIHALRRKPIGAFTVENLRFMIGQRQGVPYLLPLALEKLEADPFAAGDLSRGDLLTNVLDAEPYWGAGCRARARRIVERALERLALVRPVDWAAGELPDPDAPDEIDRENLEPRLREALSLLR